MVIRALECPRRSDTTLGFTFNFISKVAWVCLRSWSLTPSRPALPAIRRKAWVTESGLIDIPSRCENTRVSGVMSSPTVENSSSCIFLRTLSTWHELGNNATWRLALGVLGPDWMKLPSPNWWSTLVTFRTAASRSRSSHLRPKTSDLLSPVQTRVWSTGYHWVSLQLSRRWLASSSVRARISLCSTLGGSTSSATLCSISFHLTAVAREDRSRLCGV